MGYSFYLISKETSITESDYEISLNNLSPFNQNGAYGLGMSPCDVNYYRNYIGMSGSFSMSGKYIEGFVLNLLMCLMDLG